MGDLAINKNTAFLETLYNLELKIEEKIETLKKLQEEIHNELILNFDFYPPFLQYPGDSNYLPEEGIEQKPSISGNLRHFYLSDILLDLHRSGKTGILEIRNGPICKKIYIKNGDMIFAESNHTDDNLGEILLRAGRINLKHYHRAVDTKEKMGISDGKVFVELGYLNTKELAWRITHQVEEIILSLFQWEFGEFRFVESPQAAEEVQALKLSAANLIYKGIKRISNFTHIKNGYPPMDALLDYSDDPMNLFQDIKLEEKEREILFLIDGKRSVEQILSLSPLDNFKTMQTLYGLLSAGIIVEVQ